MATEKIHQREKELIELAFNELSEIKELHILAADIQERLGCILFLY